MGSVNMGRPVSQHRGGAAAAAAAVDVLTVATAVVGLAPTGGGAAVDDGGGAAADDAVDPPTEDRGWFGGGGDELWPGAVEDGGCGETDVCRRAAVSDNCKGGGLEDDDEDVCGCGNRDCGGANDAVCKRKMYCI